MKFSELINQYSNREKAIQIIYLLSSKIHSLEDYVLHKNQEIDFNLNDFEKYMADNAEPIERILKKAYFYGHEFLLLDKVFSPRHETELVVESLLEEIGEEKEYIDLCCGTGVIGISTLLGKPNLNTTLLDISGEAIENSRRNLERFNLKARLIQEDWLKHLKGHNYQIISANFPYIGESDPINGNILKYDPHMALFAKDEGWYHYERLLEYLRNNNSWELVVLECNPYHASKWNQIRDLYTNYSLKFKFDYNNLLRVVIIRRNILF